MISAQKLLNEGRGFQRRKVLLPVYTNQREVQCSEVIWIRRDGEHIPKTCESPSTDMAHPTIQYPLLEH